MSALLDIDAIEQAFQFLIESANRACEAWASLPPGVQHDVALRSLWVADASSPLGRATAQQFPVTRVHVALAAIQAGGRD